MKDKTVRFLLIANLVAMLLVLGTQMLRPTPAEAQTGKIKWEYTWVWNKANEVVDQVNKEGQNGWEAFAVTAQSSVDGYERCRVWLKRRKN